MVEPPEADTARIAEIVTEYCRAMDMDPKEVMQKPFVKIYPYSSRPYGRLYVY